MLQVVTGMSPLAASVRRSCVSQIHVWLGRTDSRHNCLHFWKFIIVAEEKQLLPHEPRAGGHTAPLTAWMRRVCSYGHPLTARCIALLLEFEVVSRPLLPVYYTARFSYIFIWLSAKYEILQSPPKLTSILPIRHTFGVLHVLYNKTQLCLNPGYLPPRTWWDG